jgi:CHAT domain
MSKPVVLFLAANPQGTNRIALDEECAAIQRELKMAPRRFDFDFQARWAVTIGDLMRELLELSPALIHFAGHGSANGIILVGEGGVAKTLSARALHDMIDSTGRSARAVVLNACFSEEQARVLSELVGCAVGMHSTIPDDAAREFSVAFYRALGFGKSIHVAFRQAKAVLVAHELELRARPQCLTRGDVNADAIIIAGDTAAARTPSKPSEASEDRAREPRPAPSSSEHNTAGRDLHQTVVGDIKTGDGSSFSFGTSGRK